MRQNHKIPRNNDLPAMFLGTGPFHEIGDYHFRRLRTVRAVGHGICLGYGIDCAVAYGNHRQIANGMKLSGIPRKDIFLTSKLFNDQQDELLPQHYQNMLRELDTEYLDLLLLHWPQTGTYIDAWKRMEELYQKGQVRSIGIANAEIRHLEKLAVKCEMLPQVIQVERNPLNTEEELLAFCQDKGIVLQAYGPTGRSNKELIESEVIKRIGRAHSKTAYQTILRWHIETGDIPVVRSIRKERIAENCDIFDFTLDPGEIEEIDSLNRNCKFYDPRRYARYY